MMSKQKFIGYQLIAFGGGIVIGILTATYLLLYVCRTVG